MSADKVAKLEKQVERLVKALKQSKAENKKLKEEMNELKCKYDSERLARAPKLWDEMKEENKRLKEEQFDNMEELAKRDGMCLVDIHLYDKLIEKEKELKEEIEKLKEEKKEEEKKEVCIHCKAEKLSEHEVWIPVGKGKSMCFSCSLSYSR